jgi:hypothetical protein
MDHHSPVSPIWHILRHLQSFDHLLQRSGRQWAMKGREKQVLNLIYNFGAPSNLPDFTLTLFQLAQHLKQSA